MKRFLLSCATAIILAINSLAADVSLIWDANPVEDAVVKYKVYERVNGVDIFKQDALTNEAKVLNVTPGRHTYVVTAVNDWESAPSNEATTKNIPNNPKNLRAVIIKVDAP